MVWTAGVDILRLIRRLAAGEGGEVLPVSSHDESQTDTQRREERQRLQKTGKMKIQKSYKKENS